MSKTFAWIMAVLVVLMLGFGLYEPRISGAYGEAQKVQLHLDEANVKMEALERRVKELEDARSLDEQRIADLEARLLSK